MDKTKVVYTIGRQFGSGGRKVGRTLAERLGIPFYDKEILTLAAKDSGLSEALFHNADEKPTSSLLYSLVMGKVNAAFSSMAGSGELRQALIRWIAEASLGLDMKNAVVSFSHLAPVDEEMLREAEKLVLASTGSTLSLTLDDKRCSEIGVVVSSTDGKVSYNNLLSTRIRRYMKDIRKTIQEENAR